MNENITFNKNKFKTMLHYIIYKCNSKKNIGKVVLFKLMYFSDFNFYELYEKPITGEIYIRKDKGPYSTDFEDIKEELIYEKKIKETQKKVYDYPKYHYHSLKKPDTSIFNEKELNIINKTISELSHMNGTEISEYSHGDIPWKIAEYGEELEYESVFYRDPQYSVRVYNEE